MILCIIFSGLSLLMAAATLVVVLIHIRKEKTVYESLSGYFYNIGKAISDAKQANVAAVDDGNAKFDEKIEKYTGSIDSLFFKHANTVVENIDSIKKYILEQNNQSEKTQVLLRSMLEGMSPDYEAAKQAKASVDSFNTGLANLLGYDPFDALEKSRRKNGGASE